MGKKLYNNGEETKGFEEGKQPDGWIRGRHTKPWNYGLTKEDERVKLLSEKMAETKKGSIPWNKGLKGAQEGWAKGLTKETDERINEFFSKNRMGKNNPHQKSTPEANLRRSETITKKILSGDYTPKSNNRNTHWESSCRGIKFRSSWEAIYHYHFPTALYEKIRIPYFDETGKSRVYISDFYHPETKTIVEIKPSTVWIKQKHKMDCVEKWCEENNFCFKKITETEIDEMKKQICEKDYELFDEKTLRKIL